MALPVPSKPALAALRPFYPLLLAAAGTLAYLNSFDNPFLFDDYPATLRDPRVRDLGACCRQLLSAPRSVTVLTLALNFELGQFKNPPRGYHALNLLVHLLAGLVLYGLVRRVLLLPSVASRLGDRAAELALAAALLWLLHPLQTESVTYIVHRGEALAGLFTLLTLYCLLRGSTGGRPWVWLLLAVPACALGMKSKETAVTAPLLALLFDRTFLAASWGEVLRRRGALHLGLLATWVLLSPALTLAFASAPWEAAAHGAAPAVDPEQLPDLSRVPLEEVGGGPLVGFGMRTITPLEYARSQPGVILHYLRLAVWPTDLCVDYGWPVARTPAEIYVPAAVVGLLLLATAWAWLRCRPLGFLGVGFFLLLAPTSSIMPIADLAAERRMYLPLAALVILAVVGGSRVLWHQHQAGAVFLIACALGMLTFQRNRAYESELELWYDTVQKAPGNPRAHYNLGLALQDRGSLGSAEESYLAALELAPQQPLTCNNLGRICLETNRPAEAADYFRRELRINPASLTVLNNLGAALSTLGSYDEAVSCYQRALQIDGQSAPTQCSLGLTLLLQDRPKDAAVHLREACRLAPGDDRALGGLGRALLACGRPAEAAEYLRKALELKPNSSRYRRDLERAEESLRKR